MVPLRLLPNGTLSTGDLDVMAIESIGQIIRDTAKEIFTLPNSRLFVFPVSIAGDNDITLVEFSSMGAPPVFHECCSLQFRKFCHLLDVEQMRIRLSHMAFMIKIMTDELNIKQRFHISLKADDIIETLDSN